MTTAELKAESHTATSLEKRFMKNKPGQTVYLFEELDLTWTKQEMKDFIYLWKEGRSLESLSKYFKRDENETALMIFYLSMRNKINPRPNGLKGDD